MNTFKLKDVKKWKKVPCKEGYEKVRKENSNNVELSVKDILNTKGVTLVDCWFVEQECPNFITGNFKAMAVEAFKRYSHKLPHPIMDEFLGKLEKGDTLKEYFEDLDNLRTMFQSSNSLKNLLESCQVFIEWEKPPDEMGTDLYYASLIFHKGVEILGEKEIEEQKKIILKYLD